MVYVYYHIYATEGVDSIIDEQISLIEKHFNFPYILNVGISIGNENQSTSSIIDRFYKYNKFYSPIQIFHTNGCAHNKPK